MNAGKRDLSHELDVLMEKAGAEVPAEWRAGVLAGYEALQESAALVRQARSAASEPSNVYRLDVILRGE